MLNLQRLLFSCILFYGYVAKAQLSGNFTINPAGTQGGNNFISFNHAVDSLKTVGVSGAVVFQVSDGIYTEQLVIPEINGASAQNTVRFTGNSSDSSVVMLTHPSTSNNAVNNYVIKLDGADYMIFEYLHLDRSGSLNYATVLTFENQSDYNIFSHNLLTGNYNGGFGGAGALIYSINHNDNFNTFTYNHFRRASVISLFYGSSAREEGNLFANNLSDSCRSGLFLKYQKRVQVLNNEFNCISTSNYHSGISLRDCIDAPKVNGNIIYFGALGDGIGLYDSDCDPSNPGEIVNNSVRTVGSSYTDGIYFYSSDNYKIYHNSVESTGSTSSKILSCPLVLSYGSKGIDLRNNIFHRKNEGVTVRADSGSIHISYCNDFSNIGDTTIYYGKAYTVQLWQTITGIDSGSFSSDPLYGINSLIPREIGLNGKASYIPGVTNDILGNTRTAYQSDIGAYEFNPAQVDLRLLPIEKSAYDACKDTSTLLWPLKNNGSAFLDSCSLSYYLNSGEWIDTILFIGLNSGEDTLLQFFKLPVQSNTNFLQIRAYSTAPASDADSSDNFRNLIFKSRMSGHYTMGGNNPDYTGLSFFFNDLEYRGVCGPVVLNIEDGDYLTSISMKPIVGVSDINTITLQSTSLDSSKVRLYYPSGTSLSSNNYVLWLEGADFIHIRHLTLERTGTNFNSVVVRLSNSAENNTISHCVLRGNTSGSSSAALIYGSPVYEHNDYNIFVKNRFTTAPYGFYLYGKETSSGIHIEDNVFDSISGFCIQLFKHDGVQIQHNIFSYQKNNGSSSAIFLDSCSNFQISHNKADFNIGSYGFYFLRCFEGDSANLVYNNSVRFKAANSSAGIFLNQCSPVQFYFNTIFLQQYFGYTSNTCIYSQQSPMAFHQLENNIFCNEAGGTVYSNQDNRLKPNRNVLFTNGPYFCETSSGFKDYDYWKNQVQLDINSPYRHPMFAANLTPRNAYINNIGLPINGITDDLSGSLRGSNPDPGALEFNVDSFVTITDVLMDSRCADSMGTLAISLINLGTATQHTIELEVIISGNNNGTFLISLNDTLPQFAAQTVYLEDSVYSLGYDSLVIQVIAKHTLIDGMNDTFKRTISIHPLPVVSFTMDSACIGQPVNFTSNVSVPLPDSIQSYTWFLGDGTTSQTKNPIYTYPQSGVYIIQFRVTSAYGCSGEMHQILHVHEPPDASFTHSVNERTVLLNAQNPRIPGATYNWDFGDGNQDTGHVTSHSYNQDGTYLVKLRIDDFPCVAESTESILIENLGIDFPDPFHLKIYPNPGKDVFMIKFVTITEEIIAIRIYDLAGVLCFEDLTTGNGSNQLDYQIKPQLTAGTYFVQLSQGNFQTWKKISVIY